MRNPFKKAGDSAAIEAELARLADRKSNVERRRSEVLQALDEARHARRDVLDSDDAAIAAASGKLKELQVEAADLAELITDLEAAIEAASERFRHARDQEARTTAAARLEAVAGKVEGQTAEFAKAAAAFAKAARVMIDSIPPEIGISPGHYADRPERRNRTGMLTGIEMVGACVADALASELPELFDTGPNYRRTLNAIVEATTPMPSYTARERQHPRPAKEIVSALIVDRLRDRAAKIRSGELDPVLDDIRPTVVQPKEPKTVSLIATEHVSLFMPNGIFSPTRRMITRGQCESFSPDRVAKLLSTGAFLKAESPEAEAFLSRHRAESDARKSSGGSIRWEDCRDLGDPMRLLEAEAEEAARAVG